MKIPELIAAPVAMLKTSMTVPSSIPLASPLFPLQNRPGKDRSGQQTAADIQIVVSYGQMETEVNRTEKISHSESADPAKPVPASTKSTFCLMSMALLSA